MHLADGRTRPDFLFIGGAKCGSTSFAMYLDAHPQVWIRRAQGAEFLVMGQVRQGIPGFFC